MNLLDTDTVSYYLKGDERVERKLKKSLQLNQALFISTITIYEIRSGLYHHDARKQLSVFNDFVSKIEIINIDLSSIDTSAIIYSHLRKSGTPIGDIDLLIAGIAIENDFRLISNNLAEFQRIKELKVESWLRD
jgi:tRNA(fMet)-specific endonuclease VapC